MGGAMGAIMEAATIQSMKPIGLFIVIGLLSLPLSFSALRFILNRRARS
jgi:hypothetical protein